MRQIKHQGLQECACVHCERVTLCAVTQFVRDGVVMRSLALCELCAAMMGAVLETGAHALRQKDREAWSSAGLNQLELRRAALIRLLEDDFPGSFSDACAKLKIPEEDSLAQAWIEWRPKR